MNRQNLTDLITGRRAAAFIASAAALAPAISFAQETDPFTTTMTTVTTKVGVYGAALVVLSGVAVVFYLGIKFVKKIPKAA